MEKRAFAENSAVCQAAFGTLLQLVKVPVFA
jgi:hypothetical protein